MNPDGRTPPEFNPRNGVMCGQAEAPSGPRFPPQVHNGGSASQDRPTVWWGEQALYTIFIWSDGSFRWVRCPLIVPVHQTNNPAPTPSRPGINLMNATVTQPSVVDKRPPGAEDEQDEVLASDETEAQENLRKDLRVPSGPPSTWEKNLKFESCANCMAVLTSLCSEATEDIEEDRREESKTTENSFLQYLEELCEDTIFVKDVESHINSDFLDALLFSEPEAFDPSFLEQQQQQQEGGMKRNSDQSSVTVRKSPSSHPDGTPRYLNPDPLTIKSNMNGQDSLEESKNKRCSALVPSWPQEEAADSHMTTFPTHGSSVKTHRAACPYCCLLLDNTFTIGRGGLRKNL